MIRETGPTTPRFFSMIRRPELLFPSQLSMFRSIGHFCFAGFFAARHSPRHRGARGHAAPAGSTMGSTPTCSGGFGSGFVQPVAEDCFGMRRGPTVGQHFVETQDIRMQAENKVAHVHVAPRLDPMTLLRDRGSPRPQAFRKRRDRNRILSVAHAVRFHISGISFWSMWIVWLSWLCAFVPLSVSRPELRPPDEPRIAGGCRPANRSAARIQGRLCRSVGNSGEWASFRSSGDTSSHVRTSPLAT